MAKPVKGSPPPKRGFGWMPSAPDSRDYRYVPSVPLATLPPSANVAISAPVWNQGSVGSCHDDQTEVLTSLGWKPFSDISCRDRLASVDPASSELIFECPQRIVRYKYDGPMYYGKTRRMDFAVTPDHKMLVRRWDQGERALESDFHLIEMKDVGWYSGLMSAVNYNGDNPSPICVINGVDHKLKSQRVPIKIEMSAWLRFLGIYLAEGTMVARRVKVLAGEVEYKNNKRYKIQLAASTEKEHAFIREVLEGIGVRGHEQHDRFQFTNKRIFAALESLGLKGVKAPEKFVPDFVFRQTASDIRQFLLGFFMGDGCEQDGRKSYYTSSTRLSNDLQRLIFLGGSSSTISVRPARSSVMKSGRVIKGNHPEHRISEIPNHKISIDRNKHVQIRHYSGEVFCAEMKTHHTLVTRRNGIILISGNCGPHSAAADLLAAKYHNVEPSRLFIYYATRRIMGTTGRDSGVYNRALFQSLSKYGYCAESMWPTSKPWRANPPAEVWRDAATRKIEAYAAVAQDLAVMKAAIAGGDPFVLGFTVYASIDRTGRDGVIPMPAGVVQGGHDVLVCGYDDARSAFRIRNSWGTSWGDGGHGWLPYSYATNPQLAGDFWTVTNKVADPVVPPSEGEIWVSESGRRMRIIEM